MSKNKTNNFCKYSCKKVIIKFLLFNDLPSYILETEGAYPFGNYLELLDSFSQLSTVQNNFLLEV